MEIVYFLALFCPLVLSGVLPHTAFEKEVEEYLDVDKFKSDMKILSERVAIKAASEQEQANEMLASIEPLSDSAALAEEEEEAVNSEVQDDLFEGDILLSNEQLAYIMADEEERAKRQATLSFKIWRNETIPFSFRAGVSDNIKSVVRVAAQFWNDNTCVHFKEQSSGNSKIEIYNGKGCSSIIGKNGGTQLLSLNNTGCNSISTATHEFEHALGVFHEQSRPGREQFVVLNEKNIEEKYISNFGISLATSDMGLPYEFGSNMHYTSNSFALNKKLPSMTAIGEFKEYQNSMRGHMPSFLDVLKVNKLYKCDLKCNGSKKTCSNGGYLDVKNCSKCICPEGFGGSDCTGYPTGCVHHLKATTTRQSYNITLSSNNVLKYEYCYYMVKADAGKKVEIIVDAVKGTAEPGCRYGGIELKTKSERRRRGLRFCGEAHDKTHISETNLVPVIAFNLRGRISAQIRYRSV